jgi:hypothetical protein
MAKQSRQNPTARQIASYQYKRSKDTPIVRTLRERDTNVHDGNKSNK